MKIPVANDTKCPIYVGATMIPAGETRHFEERDVPAHLRPAPAEAVAEAPTDPLADLLAKSVKDIIAAMPALSTEDIERLGELEQVKSDAARKTLLSAISETVLKRAEAEQAEQRTQGGEGEQQ